jgi:hypothetical protein
MASEPSRTAPFTGLSPRHFRKLITSLKREGADRTRSGRPWSLPLEDGLLLVAACWRTNLTLRQLAPLFGVSKSSADRITDHTGPQLAFNQRQRFRRDTALIVDAPSSPLAITPSPSSQRRLMSLEVNSVGWRRHVQPQRSGWCARLVGATR